MWVRLEPRPGALVRQERAIPGPSGVELARALLIGAGLGLTGGPLLGEGLLQARLAPPGFAPDRSLWLAAGGTLAAAAALVVLVQPRLPAGAPLARRDLRASAIARGSTLAGAACGSGAVALFGGPGGLLSLGLVPLAGALVGLACGGRAGRQRAAMAGMWLALAGHLLGVLLGVAFTQHLDLAAALSGYFAVTTLVLPAVVEPGEVFDPPLPRPPRGATTGSGSD